MHSLISHFDQSFAKTFAES